MPRRPKVRAEPVTILDPAAPVTLTHTVGGLSVEVPPIVREESAEKWGYAPPVGGGPLAEVADSPTEGASLTGVPDGSVTPGEPEGAFTHTVERSAPRELSITLPDDGSSCKVYASGIEEPVFVWPPTLPARTMTEIAMAEAELGRISRLTEHEMAGALLAEDPRTALALYRRVSRGYGLAEWRPLGAGAQLVDLGTGDMLALVAPEGRSFVASYVESGTNLAGPMADTLDACKDAVANRMRARGVGVL